MKNFGIVCFLLALAAAVPALGVAREIPPFVSTDWLEANLNNPRLTTVDIREGEEYHEGHIPGAVNMFFGYWIIDKDKLQLELPADDDILALIGALGIKPNSLVVVLSSADNDYARVNATRVALTMIAAGLKDVAVLDGGYAKWLEEGRSVSTGRVAPKAVEYKGKVNRAVVASRAYVMSKIGKSTIVDDRDASLYFGVATEPFAPRPGHIKSAVNLPAPWVYTREGTLLSRDDIAAMAASVMGKDKSKEIIVYCNVGDYSSTWWFLLTQMLGYKNVLLYDGSAQDWAADQKDPMTVYGWH
jgi:thiosulfate/3-mercaptopyruvate sulfurtransferase